MSRVLVWAVFMGGMMAVLGFLVGWVLPWAWGGV